MRKYLLNVLIAIDQGVNALLGGDPDETISSRAAKGQDRLYWRMLGRVLEFLDPGHLERSLEEDEGADAIYSSKNEE